MKMLVISFHFAPYLSAESLVGFKLLNNLNMDIDVIFASLPYNKIDDKIMDGSKISLYEIDYKSEENTSFINKIISKVNWFYKSFLKIKRLIKNQDYDFIHSRSMPMESHFLGYVIKKIHPELTWVVSFSDPWYNSPYNKQNKFK